MNSFIAPDITVYDIIPEVDVQLGSGSKVPNVPE